MNFNLGFYAAPLGLPMNTFSMPKYLSQSLNHGCVHVSSSLHHHRPVTAWVRALPEGPYHLPKVLLRETEGLAFPLALPSLKDIGTVKPGPWVGGVGQDIPTSDWSSRLMTACTHGPPDSGGAKRPVEWGSGARALARRTANCLATDSHAVIRVVESPSGPARSQRTAAQQLTAADFLTAALK